MKQHDILNHIYLGKENAVTRKQLVIETGLTDRQVRDAIAEARRDVTIINEQDGRGYYIPEEGKDDAKVRRQVRQEEKRAKSIFYSLKGAREYLKKVGC